MDKTFIASSIKEHVFPNGGKVLNVAIKLDDLAKYSSEDGWVNVSIYRRKAISEKGQTHYMVLDEYRNKNKKKEQPEQQKETINEKDINVEDIPF